MDNKKEKKHNWISFFFLFIAVLFAIAAVVVYFYSNNEAYTRVEEERQLADAYLEYIISAESPETTISASDDSEKATSPSVEETSEINETEISEEYGTVETVEESTFDFQNFEEITAEKEYYNWSPEYAQGTLDCVLDYPDLNIRRGVYKGAMENDLACWMVVTANDNAVLGETSYPIYGHNSMTFEVSLNALLNAKIGQKFSLINETGEYHYIVSDIFYGDRTAISKEYAWTLDEPEDKCYIITCGRYEHRYTDMVVEGTLSKVSDLDTLKEELLVDEDKTIQTNEESDNTEKAETQEEIVTSIQLTYHDNTLFVSRIAEETIVPGGKLALYYNDSKVREWVPGETPEEFEDLEDGTYEVYELTIPDGNYRSVDSVRFRIQGLELEQIKDSTLKEMIESIQSHPLCAALLIGSVVIVFLVLIVAIIRRIKRKNL